MPFPFQIVSLFSHFLHWICADIFVIVQFLWGLGLPLDEAECCDVYGLDEELLEMVPKPVLAVLFLYPITAQVFVLSCQVLLWLHFLYLTAMWIFFFTYASTLTCKNSSSFLSSFCFYDFSWISSEFFNSSFHVCWRYI